MSDINKNDTNDKSAEDLLGLDNENILAHRKNAEETPVPPRRSAQAGQQVRKPAQTDRAAQQRRVHQGQRPPEEPTRQMPRQNPTAPAVQRPATPRQARPVQNSASQARQQYPSAPHSSASQSPQRRIPAVRPQESAAVVPSEKKEVAHKPEKRSVPTPAYASRRSVVSSAPSASNHESGATKNSSSVATPPASGKNTSSTKAGADMMVSIVKGIIYMVLVLVVSVFISIFAIRVGNDVFAFVKSDEQIDITIPENATTAEIADILYDNGIIKYPSVFKMYASLKHEKGDYLGGTYTVSPSLSYDKLRGKFKKQIETGTCWITIPEGYTTDEIIDLMVENGIGEREKYIDVINNYDFDYWFVEELKTNGVPDSRAYRLDGYLFPDSYQFYKASSEVTVINRLLARFNEVFVEDYRTRASELGYTVDQILTIASMVEKEAARAADFMNVSSVFHNRLHDPYNFPKMQSDATTVYAIQIATGQRPKDVAPEDNNYDSPYNTYLYEGLPPGPITNPSASAIRYALYPANTNYKYFVSAKNGTTLFAATKGEHDANIETVRKMNTN